MCDIEWLPDLVLFEDYYGDWNSYVEALYEYFTQDFIRSKPNFYGVKLGLKRYPEELGKAATFWHMISEGKEEAERTTDFRRCERIRWPRPTIDNSPHDGIRIWENKRGSEKRILLLIEEYKYLVVLAKRKGYILPWTAYYLKHDNEVRRKLKEYERYVRRNGDEYKLEM